MDLLGARPTHRTVSLLKANDTLATSFSDVTIASTIAAQALVWNGSAWVNGRAVNDNQPGNDGFIGRTYDQSAPGQSISSTGVAGTVYVARIELPDRALTVTNMHFILGTVGAGLANCFTAIYDSGGTRRLLSANEAATGSFTSTTTPLKTIPGASAATWAKGATINDFCWMAILFGTATTLPGFWRAMNGTPVNGLTTGATTRWGTVSSGLSAMPASFTPSSGITVSNVANWCGIS
jgi:hypothetical protein